MRWHADPNSPGEEYCKACKASRNSDNPCGGCLKPNQVLTPNQPVFHLVAMMGSQWRYTHEGRRIGMDYNALNAVMDNYDIDNRSLMFERIRICEKELLLIEQEQHG